MIYEVVANNRDKLPVKTMCDLFEISRGSFYQYQSKASNRSQKDEQDAGLTRKIKKILEVFYGYGYRRVTKQLMRQGTHVNHKKVRRLMRQAGLQCRRKRRFVTTTNSLHALRTYPNLAKGFVPKRLNELWVADITYIRLVYDFCYLATVLDVFSRKVIGWQISRSIDHRLAKDALEMAISTRSFAPGLIHHSDQGIQYATRQYIDTLKANQISISMSRKGNPYDNAFAESFYATLKKEEVNISEYETFLEAKRSIYAFIDKVYNQKRLHSALDYVPPVEFEEQLLAVGVST